MKKFKFCSFDFWQKFGKALMVVVAVMPAAGLMISIGKVIGIYVDVDFIKTFAKVMEDIGWAIIGNLNLLFAIAIGGSWAKERAGGAFAAALAFILTNRITGVIFGVTSDMLTSTTTTMVESFTGQELVVGDYFVSVLGAPALNMGVFIGIISGFLGAALYNKYYNYDKLPNSLSFFNGKRFVPFVVILGSSIAALILSFVWPFAQYGLNQFGEWIAESKDTAPVIAPFLYGSLERLLLPFGLHHMLTIPMNYTEFGGVYNVLTGATAGSVVAGQDPLWLAWITDLNNLKQAGDMAAYNNLFASITPARFKAGQVILSSASLIGVAFAMYKNVDPDKKKKYKTMFFSAAIAVFLTGVTEPLEFMFMFVSPILYVVYSIIAGIGFAMADILNLRVHAFGFIELITRIPLMINAGLLGDVINFLLVAVAFFFANFGIMSILIKKFNIATPGRAGNYIEDGEEGKINSKGISNGVEDAIAKEAIALLGGKDNIVDVDACMTRLRVTVKDIQLVGDEKSWKSNGAIGLVIKDKGVQAIYGPKADILKSNIQDILGV
ncbi:MULTISPECIES: PTS transporter subunit IIBC [Clostridium]|uniref:PTS transporter subunit IIBC n=1 Tax=Clostridium nitritogenes TaxID=83340 RepID=A0ABP3WUP5_9CLOT|nr:PTS transporter subunit IIBC [Clostridium baratii]AQM61444.1 PTS transporter subunit IICB [Clostridium baratii]KJU70712.1 PTS system transporter subunit IICB [Clostridium baratii]MBS6006356.1 PTS transporter subunit IIBC [Clostridium baratii]MBT9832920.1 PTS transporter subunit IICB [Clostridium baratii]STA99157.1 PTS system transporter subunit IIBC [Clostridium baratii]